MQVIAQRWLSICGLSLLGACADGSGSAPAGARVEIAVAPLQLPGITDAEYALAVFDGAPSNPMFDEAGAVVGETNRASLVWAEPSITSGAFGSGSGGDLLYIGTCDAEHATNYVALALEVLSTADGPLVDQPAADPDFVNPCDYTAPCVLEVACAENEDSRVTFDLTVMRDAGQGFFDVAVQFRDIFCSAKAESCYVTEGSTSIGGSATVTVNGATYYQYNSATDVTYWATCDAATSLWLVYPEDPATVDAGPKLGAIPERIPGTCGAAPDPLKSYTVVQPDGVTFSSPLTLVFFDGYLGTQGTNTNQCNDIQTFAEAHVEALVLTQEDDDGDGQFDAPEQGNDRPFFAQLVFDDGSVTVLPTALNFRETTGSKLEVAGFIFAPGIDVTTSTGLHIVGGSTKDASSCLGPIALDGTAGFLGDLAIAKNRDRSGNAATTGLFAALNSYLAATIDPAGLTLVTSSTTVSKTTQPIKLLFGPTSHAREQTQVFGLACTAQPGTSDGTSLLLSDVAITCMTLDALNVTYALDLGGAASGNLRVNAVGSDGTGAFDGLPVAYYYGTEDLACAGASCNKAYFNVAVDTQFLADLGLVCRMSYAASAVAASDTTTFDTTGALADPAAKYGMIVYDAIPLTVASEAGIAPSCNSYQVGTAGYPDGAVKVKATYLEGLSYGGAGPTVDFDYSYDGGAVTALAEPAR